MDVVATFPAGARGIDHVIVWDDGTRLVAFAYKGGRVVRTSPLAAQTVAQAKSEAAAVFGVEDPTRARWAQRSSPRW